MTAYLGLDLLDAMPMRQEVPAPSLSWVVARLDSQTGKLVVDALAKAGRVGRPGVWLARDRTTLQTFRDFVTVRQGRRVPFWLPTWQNDLPLLQPAVSGSSSVVIRGISYTRYTFGAATFARRYVVLITAGGTVLTPHKITGAVDNGNGTETLTVDGTLGVDLDPAAAMLSFLTYVRLADDGVVFRHFAQDLAVIALPTVEIPTETPTF